MGKPKAKAPTVLTKKIDLVIEQDQTSWSGKYHCLFGFHWVEGFHCWDIAVLNGLTGEVVRRHYNEKTNPEAKAQCIAAWAPFIEGMLRAPEGEETDEAERYFTLN